MNRNLSVCCRDPLYLLPPKSSAKRTNRTSYPDSRDSDFSLCGAAAICHQCLKRGSSGHRRDWHLCTTRRCQQPPAKASKRLTPREPSERKAQSCPTAIIPAPEKIASTMACGYLPHSLLLNRRFEQLRAIVAPWFSTLLGTYFATHIINTLSNLVKKARRQNECKHRHKTTDLWTNSWQCEYQNLPRVILRSPWLSKTSYAFYLWFTKDYMQQPI